MLDSYSPVKRNQDVSPIPTARIPKSYVPQMEKLSDSSSSHSSEESEKSKTKTDEEDRPNIRVSSTPRPRAIISSPENDAVIGNRNRIKGEYRSALKNNNMVQNRHATRSHIFARSSLKTRKSKDDTDCNSEIRGKKGPGSPVSSHRSTDRNSEIRGKKGPGSPVSSRRRHVITERPSWQDP